MDERIHDGQPTDIHLAQIKNFIRSSLPVHLGYLAPKLERESTCRPLLRVSFRLFNIFSRYSSAGSLLRFL